MPRCQHQQQSWQDLLVAVDKAPPKVVYTAFAVIFGMIVLPLIGRRVAGRLPLCTLHIDLRIRHPTVLSTMIVVQMRIDDDVHILRPPAHAIHQCSREFFIRIAVRPRLFHRVYLVCAVVNDHAVDTVCCRKADIGNMDCAAIGPISRDNGLVNVAATQNHGANFPLVAHSCSPV